MASRNRTAAYLLTVSLAGIGSWAGYEGFTETPVIPVEGDVPTIGHGSTHYENGEPVQMGDAPISRKRAKKLARTLMAKDEKRFRRSIPNVKLYQAEYDLYVDFIGQYGIGNWMKSSMRRNLLQGNHRQACEALLKWRYAAGYDCSTKIDGQPNKRCWGVWKRQKERHQKCLNAQGD